LLQIYIFEWVQWLKWLHYVVVICGTLENELVYALDMHGEELCSYWIQMYWFMAINVLGGATGIGPSSGQGHPTGGTGRWFPPFSCMVLMFWNDLLMDDILLNPWWMMRRRWNVWLNSWRMLKRL